MVETMDQIFVTSKHWLVGLAPTQWQPVVSALLSVAAIVVTFATLFALTTLLERKGLGRMQNRYGPNRVGPYGLLQPIADGLKALTKEDIVPRTADKVVHFARAAGPGGAGLPGPRGCADGTEHGCPGHGCRGVVLLRRRRGH